VCININIPDVVALFYDQFDMMTPPLTEFMKVARDKAAPPSSISRAETADIEMTAKRLRVIMVIGLADAAISAFRTLGAHAFALGCDFAVDAARAVAVAEQSGRAGIESVSSINLSFTIDHGERSRLRDELIADAEKKLREALIRALPDTVYGRPSESIRDREAWQRRTQLCAEMENAGKHHNRALQDAKRMILEEFSARGITATNYGKVMQRGNPEFSRRENPHRGRALKRRR
jgi:hypothetical protein